MSMIIIIMSFTSLQFLENFLQFPHVLCKHNIRFFWNSLLEKAKSCYWIIIFLCRVINMKFYWYIAAFLFFFFFKKDKKLKKLAVAIKFLHLLTVLILNSVFLLIFFTWKDISLWYKFAKGRNHLKPENLETFLCYQH